MVWCHLATSHYLKTNVNPDLCHHVGLLHHRELTVQSQWKHSYCFKQESWFHFVNPETAMITTASGGLLASRYITTTRHSVINTNRGWKNHDPMPHQVFISYPCYTTMKSCMIGHSSLTGFCLSKIYTMFQMIFLWKYGFCTWILGFNQKSFNWPTNNNSTLVQLMVWYWAGDKPSAEPMIIQSNGHQTPVL